MFVSKPLGIKMIYVGIGKCWLVFFWTCSAVDVDIKNKRVYWTDVRLKTINRVYLNGSMAERIITFGLQTPEGNFLLIYCSI